MKFFKKEVELLIGILLILISDDLLMMNMIKNNKRQIRNVWSAIVFIDSNENKVKKFLVNEFWFGETIKKVRKYWNIEA